MREFLKQQETKKGARYLRPLAQMVRVNFWWSVVRDGTSTKGEVERTMATKFDASASDGQWQEGVKEQSVGGRSVERRVMGAVEKLPGKLSGALDGARKPRDLSEVQGKNVAQQES